MSASRRHGRYRGPGARSPRWGWGPPRSDVPPFRWSDFSGEILTRGSDAQGCGHHAWGCGRTRVGAREARSISPVSVDAPGGVSAESPAMAVVAAETYEALSGISAGDLKLLDDAMG